jgi:FcoT-like thioesterase domain
MSAIPESLVPHDTSPHHLGLPLAERVLPFSAAARSAGALDDVTLMARVLRPYKPNCRYLLKADVTRCPDEPERVVARCELSIPESCYIDDTGHFNSVEFNICYNQMVYYAIAKTVQNGLLPSLAGWTLEDFWRKQLPDILITRFESCFRKPVQPRRFHGEVTLSRARYGGGATPMLLLRTTCRFWDDDGGHCDGNIVLALLNVPRPGVVAPGGHA